MSKPGIDDCCTSLAFDAIMSASQKRLNGGDCHPVTEARHMELMRMLDRIANALEEGNRHTISVVNNV